MSELTQALANVDAFEATASRAVAWRLDRGQTLQRIRALLRQPDLINQRGLSACAPAVFFRIWFARDPVAAAGFSCGLLRDGSAPIGSLIVAPSSKLLGQDYSTLRAATDAAHPNMTPEGADWMLLSALRDSENIWFDYTGEPFTLGDMVAGLTLPSTLVGWLSATNRYSSVTDDTSVVTVGSKQRLPGLIPTSNVDHICLVSSSFDSNLYPSPQNGQPSGLAGAHIPDHYILMTAPLAEGNNAVWLNIEFWSWGRTVKGWTGSTQFFSKCFGAITATAR
ncbi:MAG: hypothetical protein GEU82_04465 [Luteitalea sp.]|nr:hypothetical protein [Luteitalea sp.]